MQTVGVGGFWFGFGLGLFFFFLDCEHKFVGGGDSVY